MQVVRADQSNGEAWYLLSLLVADPAQKADCQLRAQFAGYQIPQVPLVPMAPVVAASPAVFVKPTVKPRRRNIWLVAMVGIVLIAAVASSGVWAVRTGRITGDQATALRRQAPVVFGELTCQEQSTAFVDRISEVFDDWEDALTLAGQTSRIALSPQVARLQDIRRQINDIDAPLCAYRVKHALVDSMDYSIMGFLAFMSDDSDLVVERHFERAGNSLNTFVDELAGLRDPSTDVPSATSASTY